MRRTRTRNRRKRRVVLDVRLFGQAVVSADGAPVKLSRRPVTLAMLAYLLLHRDRPVGREFLAYLLFPDIDEATALAELRRYLYLAQKAFPTSAEPWILSDGDTVQWNAAAPVRLDVAEFERLAADHATAGAAAVEYRGDLLEDAYDDWIVVERERLRGIYLGMLTRSISVARAERNFSDAVRDAQRLLATDPWREDVVRELVATRYESGDAAGALAEYEAFAKRLRAELDVAPMPETVAVREAIVRNTSLPGSVGTPAPQTAQRDARVLPFVGRARELETLRAAWQRAARGNGGLVLLSGEAGAGKTRLAAEAARVASAEGGRVFGGTTSGPESVPYQAFAEAFASALPLLLAQPLEPHHRAALAAVVGELRVPGQPPGAGDPANERTRLFGAMAAAIKRLGTPRPLLLVLEDLHWAGNATAEALGALVRACARVPVLFLATARDEETPRTHPLRTMLRGFAAGDRVAELPLDRLNRDDVAALVARSDVLRDDPHAADALYARSEGNALFLSEAIAEAVEGEGRAASSIAAVVDARLQRLSDDARTVAEIAAVAGPGCTVDLVREVAGLPPVAAARGFDELLDRRLLREAGARDRYDYVFTHHLIADAVYAGIAEPVRKRRHARIARVLESAHEPGDGSVARQIAVHCERGGDRDAAAAWYVSAARGAAAVYAYADAAELATLALAMGGAEPVRRDALRVRETAAARLGDRDARRADLDALEQLAGDDATLRFEALERRIALARSLGDAGAETGAIDALALLAEGLGESERAQALRQRATAAGLRSRQRDGIAYASDALARYERLGDRAGQLECLFLLLEFCTNVGDLERAREYLAVLQARAATFGDRAIEARALDVTALAALHRQAYRECFETTKAALGLYRATGDREGETAARARLAVAAAWMGDYALALHEFPPAIAGYEALDNKRGIAVALTNFTTLLLRIGLLDEARGTLERSNELFRIAGERRTIVANTSNASVIALLQGNAAEARDLARTALADAREIAFPVFEAAALANLANAERELGNFDEAVAHHAASLALRRTVQQPEDYIDDLADIAMTYARAGRPNDAREAAAALRDVAEASLDRAFWPHYVQWAISRGYAAAGDGELAARYARDARAALDALLAATAPTRAGTHLLDIALNAEIATSR